MLYLLIALIAGLLAAGLLKLALQYFPRWGLLDSPGKYGFKRAPVPYSVGLTLYMLFVLALVIPWLFNFLPDLGIVINMKLWGVIGGATILLLTSFIDDRIDLSPFLRLGVQIIVVSLIVTTGTYVDGINIPFIGWWYFGDLGGQVATGIWLLMLVNTMNWLDGVPGLVTGLGTIVLFTLYALGAIVPLDHTIPQEFLSYMSVVLGMGCLVLFVVNYRKLRFLIGDSGSMFMGLMIGVLAVYAGGKIATAALVLALPLFDVFWIVLRRIWQGKSPFKGDLFHLHHRLQRTGLTRAQLLTGYLGYSVIIAVLSLLLGNSESKGVLAVVLLLVLLLAAGTIVYLERKAE